MSPMASIYLGTVISAGLYGILCSQTFLYLKRPKGAERPWIKYLAGVLFFVDTLCSLSGGMYLYQILVVHFGSVQTTMWPNWLFAIDPALIGIIAGFVQLFYAWRVHVLIKNIYITCVIALGAVAGATFGIASSIAGICHPIFAQWLHRFRWIFIAWLGLSASTDIVVALVLIWFLHKCKTGQVATDSVIDRVIRVTLQTGMFTAFVALSSLVSFVAVNGGLSLIFNIPLSKVYTISFMSMLNSSMNASHGESSAPDDNQFTTIIQTAINTKTSQHASLNIQVEDTLEDSTQDMEAGYIMEEARVHQ